MRTTVHRVCTLEWTSHIGHPIQREPEINKLFRMMMRHEASELHLQVGQPPTMRVRGDMRPFKYAFEEGDSCRVGISIEAGRFSLRAERLSA